jgi:transposase-like protein
MAKEKQRGHAPQASAVRSAEEKVRIVMAAAALAPDELGAFLRREGVHEAELEQWRAAVLEAGESALEGSNARAPTRSNDSKRVKELERELRRKDKALAEAAALLVLQKKFHTYLEERDRDTDEENEK